MNQEQKSYFQNWLTVLGKIGSIISAVALLTLMAMDLLAHKGNLYLEGFTYLVAPLFLIFSLLLIPLGAVLERRRRRKKGAVATHFPKIDFNNPYHQRVAFITWAVFTVFGLFSLVGAYRAYEFTESVAFCGELCHTVMQPEHTAYHNSPHARVSCAQCHIGSGAGWYVRSKLSGAYQIYSTAFGLYSQPIETPIKNLRPAQETCEQCHWPKKFFGAVEQDHNYYLPDETNSEWKTRMLISVGGGTPAQGQSGGIHWHMNIANPIYYIATDDKRQEIPWTKVVRDNGEEVVYAADGSGYSKENPPSGEMRRMDCIDCHNRPSHIYLSPAKALNRAIFAGQIDQSLPYIKREAVDALVGEYSTHEDAAEKIKARLEKFYQEEYPQVMSDKREILNRSIEGIIAVYKMNFFPEMKVRWQAYPDNIGHMIFPGCYRCHDGEHLTKEGKALTHECNVCHKIISQGNDQEQETSVDGLEFKHPVDIEEAWKESPCYECHTGENT